MQGVVTTRPPLTGILKREGYVDTARTFSNTMPITKAVYDLFLDNLPTIGTIKKQNGTTTIEKIPEEDERVRVFLNIFVPSIDLVASTTKLLTEELSLIHSDRHVIHHVDSIGVKFLLPDNVVHFRHFPYYKFTDEITLRALWHHCHEHPSHTVAYLRAGDFKFSSATRLFATGPLSSSCASLSSSNTTCDVCGTRTTPIPHPQTIGNAWTARCEYVTRLDDPIEFGEKMGLIAPKRAHCRGVGFYAGAHWVNSHPTVRMCDVHPSRELISVKDAVGMGEYVPDLRAAPRFPLSVFAQKLDRCHEDGEKSEQRIREYIDLYGTAPSETWWGWGFFGVPYKSYDK